MTFRVIQWVVRKHAQFPQRGNFARIRTPLISPLGRRTMPAWSPPHGFLHHTIGSLKIALCILFITEIRKLTI